MRPVFFKLLLFCSIVFSPLVSVGQTQSLLNNGSGEVRILSWNIFMRPLSVFAKDGQLERAEGIVEQLKDDAYDIIVFQEAFEKRAREIVWDGLKEKFPFQAGPGEGSLFKINSGVWILSKFEFTKIEGIEFNTCKIADCISKKGAILVEFIKEGKAFQVIGTHLQAENYPEVRKEQFTDISEKLLKPFQKENVPQFIAGDLNTAPDDEVNYKEMLTLLNAEDHAPQKEKSWLKELVTWGGMNNDLFQSSYKRTPQLLDYILLRNNGRQPTWIEKSIEVIQQAWNKTKTKKDLSDHYAVAATIYY